MSKLVSVIIPVYNDAEHLRACLEHLARSSSPYHECIVVDDGSSDGSADLAQRLGAQVLSTGGRTGPAHARNLGARKATGEILFFLDSDVCVHHDTLARLQAAFAEDAELDALIGSYDDSPQSKDFLSQYKNLMHCFVHQRGRRKACTFWSGCGAVRRNVFLEHAGFDETTFRRPAVEDIELGYRMFTAGRKMILDKGLQVKHLKRWTFWGLIKTDIFDRAIPWTELILRDRHMPNDLNLELSQRVSVALAFLLMGVALAATLVWGWYFLTPLVAVLMFLLARYWVEGASERRSPAVVAAMTIATGVIVWRAMTHDMPGIVPPLLLGYLLLFLRHRYAYSDPRRRRWSGFLLAAYIVGALGLMFSYFPAHILIFTFFVIAAAIVVLNTQFYFFLAARQGRVFALAAIPFHLLYHLYNGLSFFVGLLHYGWRSFFHRKSALEPVPRGNGRP